MSVGNFYKTQNYSDAFHYSHKKIKVKTVFKKMKTESFPLPLITSIK